LKWAQRHGGVPINHMAVVRTELSKSRPDVVKELFRLLWQQTGRKPGTGALEPLRFGVEAGRPTLEVIIDYAPRQGLIPRKLAVDELFDDTTRALVP